MIGLDTNVLVRYIMQDDVKQSAKATKVIESLTVNTPGYVSLVAMVELSWVLSVSYGLTRDQVAQAIDALLRTKEIVVESKDSILKALRVFNTSSADFADCLIAQCAVIAGCSKTMTFDVGAAKVAGMTLIQ